MELLKQVTKEERKRRLRASSSAYGHKNNIKLRLDAESVNSLLEDDALTKDEIEIILSRLNRPIQNKYLKILKDRNDDESLRKIMNSEIMTREQKLKILSRIRRSYIEGLQYISQRDECFEYMINSIIFTEDEKTNILFSLDEIRSGKCDISPFISEKEVLDILKEYENEAK